MPYLTDSWTWPFFYFDGRTAMAKSIHQLTAAQFDTMFPDEEACWAYLVGRRWPKGVRCPRCGSDRVYDLKTRNGIGSARSAPKALTGSRILLAPFLRTRISRSATGFALLT